MDKDQRIKRGHKLTYHYTPCAVARKAAGYTQRGWAKRLRYSYSNVKNYELSLVHTSKEYRRRASLALNKPEAELFPMCPVCGFDMAGKEGGALYCPKCAGEVKERMKNRKATPKADTLPEINRSDKLMTPQEIDKMVDGALNNTSAPTTLREVNPSVDTNNMIQEKDVKQ